MRDFADEHDRKRYFARAYMGIVPSFFAGSQYMRVLPLPDAPENTNPRHRAVAVYQHDAQVNFPGHTIHYPEPLDSA